MNKTNNAEQYTGETTVPATTTSGRIAPGPVIERGEILAEKNSAAHNIGRIYDIDTSNNPIEKLPKYFEAQTEEILSTSRSEAEFRSRFEALFSQYPDLGFKIKSITSDRDAVTNFENVSICKYLNTRLKPYEHDDAKFDALQGQQLAVMKHLSSWMLNGQNGDMYGSLTGDARKEAEELITYLNISVTQYLDFDVATFGSGYRRVAQANAMKQLVGDFEAIQAYKQKLAKFFKALEAFAADPLGEETSAVEAKATDTGSNTSGNVEG